VRSAPSSVIALFRGSPFVRFPFVLATHDWTTCVAKVPSETRIVSAKYTWAGVNECNGDVTPTTEESAGLLGELYLVRSYVAARG